MSNSLSIPAPAVRGKPGDAVRWLRANWLALLAVLWIGGLAAGLRLLTYERYLPYVDYTDEAVYVALALDLRDLSDETALRQTYGTLPPLYSWWSALMQSVYDGLKTHSWRMPAEYYQVMRLVAVAMGVLTALGMTWIAWTIAGPVAGWLAGLIWATCPLIVELNSLAIPDPPLYLCMVSATAAGIYAWRTGSRWALLAALVIAIIATYLKYWLVTVTFPFLLVGAVLFRRSPRAMLPWGITFAAIAIVPAAFLVLAIDPLETNNTLNKYDLSSLMERATSIPRLTNNFWHAAYPIGVPLLLAGLVGGGIAYLYSRRQGRSVPDSRFIALLLLIVGAGLPLTTAISNVDLFATGRMRHILPTITILMVLWGVAVAQIVRTIRQELTARRITDWRALVLAALPIAIIVIALLPVYVTGNLETVERLHQSHMVNRVRDWSDVAIPGNDGMVMQPYNSSLDRTWNRIWGAYAGNNPLLYWSERQEDIIAATPQDYADRGIRYLVINEVDLTSGDYDDPRMRDFLAQLYLLKTFPLNDRLIGSETYFYQMLPPEFKTDFVYGEQISLEGYDLSASTIAAGETLTFRPYWRLKQFPSASYSMFVHLYPADELTLVTQQDGAPVNHDRPTLAWNDLNEVYIGRDVVLPIPADLKPGAYRLAVGMYDFATGQRLRDGDHDFFTIPLTVE